MTDRPTSRTVTAYARGLYLAQVFQLAVAVIAILAVVIGGYMVKQQTERLNATKNELAEANIRLGAVKEETGTNLSLNERLVAATVALSEAHTGDAFGSELAYTRAFEELTKALAEVPAAPTETATDEWTATRQTIRKMMVGTLTSGKRYPEAIGIQSELVARSEAGSENWATYSAELAALHCQVGDFGAASAIVTDAFREAHPEQLNNNAYKTNCAGAPQMAAPGAAADDAAAEAEDAAPASVGIRIVYLHIRQEDQRRAAANIAEQLCSNGLTVRGIELVAPPRGYPATPRAIYYYPDQLNDAQTIASAVQNAAGKLGLPAWNRSIDTRLYQAENLPRDRVEIWLPDTGGTNASLGAGVSSCKARVAASSQIAQLVADLNAADSPTRLAAGQQIATVIRSSESAAGLDALVGQLESPQVEKLSATGRFNVLYMLNLAETWKGLPAASRLSAALDQMEQNAASGRAAIGGQTRDCIDKLKLKLAGNQAPDACGGR